jgi:TonB-dependent receptor
MEENLEQVSGNTYRVSGEEIFEKDVKDRYEVQDIVAISAGTEININKLTLDMHAGYSFAQEDEPDRHNSDFEMGDSTSYRFSMGDKDIPSLVLPDEYYNSDLYTLKKIEVENNNTKDQNIEGSLNATLPVSGALELKAGLKGRLKMKERDNQFEEYEVTDNEPLMTAFKGSYNNPDFLDGKYGGAHRNFADRDKLRDYLDAHKNDESYFEKIDESELREENYAGDYEATEKVGAGYLQGKFNIGNVSLLAGARGEYTGFLYDGYRVVVNEDGDYEDVQKTSGDASRFDLLPMAHVKYAFTDKSNLRFAYTRTFARPDFYDLVPYELTNKEDNEKELGNSDLDLQFSNNFDLLGEHYFSTIGLVSAGLFYKDMSDFIYERTWKDGDYEVKQSTNADEAYVFGLEVNYEMQMTFLPGFLSGFGLGANYTWTTSEATVTEIDEDDNSRDRDITLPGQSDHLMNAFLMYEMEYFNVKAAINYHSEFLDEVGSSKAGDAYYDKHFQLDLSAGVKPLKNQNLMIFAEFVNLTNEPLRYYTEVSGTEVAKQQEYYSWWSHFGVKYSF